MNLYFTLQSCESTKKSELRKGQREASKNRECFSLFPQRSLNTYNLHIL